MKKRAEIELGYKLKNASAVTRFSARLRQAFDQAGADADKLNRRMGLVERAVDKLPIKWQLAGGSAARALEKTSRAADRAWARLKGGASTITGVIGRLTRGVFNLKTALIGLGLGYVAGDFIKVADSTDRMKIALDQLTNGKGEEWFRKLNEWAFKMPVNTDKAIQAFIRLRSFGLTPTIKQMTILVDSTIGVGRGEEALESVSRALGQIAARGKLSAEELNQLAEAGLPAKEMLASAFRTTTAELENMITKGLIPSRVAVAALIEEMERRFGGASSKMQQKWAGLTDALKSHWSDFQRNVMGPGGVMGFIEKSLARVVGKLDELRSSGRLREWAERAGRAVEGALQKGVNFVEDIINNWSRWEARWEKFKSGAAEVWRQTKNVAGVVGSLLKTALEGWNNLPPVIREFGLVGALIGGVKGKLIFAALVGISAMLDKAKEFSKGEPDLHIGPVTMPGRSERGYLFKFRQWLEEQQGKTPPKTLHELGRGYYQAPAFRPDSLTQGLMTAAPSYKDLEAQLMAEVQTGLSVSQASLKRALTMQISAGGGAAPRTDWRSQLGKATAKGLTDAEKLVAKANAATAKRQQEYIRMIAESVELEKQLRRQGLTDHERNLDQLKDKYETTQERIDDLVLGGVITEEKAAGLKAKLNTLYLDEVEKAQAKHDQSLLRSIATNGLKGRELKLAQLQFELQDLEEAGHSAILIEQYKAQQLEEINKSWLERTLDAWGDAQTVIPEATKNALQGTQTAWANYLASGLKSFESFTDAIEATWRQMLAQLIAQWSMSGFAGLVKDFINLLKGGSGWSNTIKGFGLEGLFGGGKDGGVVGKAGALASLASGVKTVAGWLGLGGGAPATGAAAYTGITGAAAAGGEFAASSAATGLGYSAYGGTMAGGEFAGTFGATSGLSAMAGPMLAAIGPGMAGMMLSQMGFLMDGPMSPEEAISNWEGQANFITTMTEKMSALGQTLEQVSGGGFELFGQAAQDAAADLERLKTVAGYSQDQVDALVEAMNPLARQFIKSGQAANSLESEVEQLVTQINAAENSMALTGAETRLFEERIADLAQRFGLTGDDAERFKDRIFDLAGQFSQGGEEAQRFGRSLDEFISGTLGDLTEGAGASTEALGGLLDRMGRVREAGKGINQMTFSTPRGGVNEVGLSTGPALGNAELGYYHGGGVVERLMRRLPRFHDGGDVLSWLQPGEFVTRRRSVNPATLPTLRHINATGRPPAQSVNQFQAVFHVSVEGGAPDAQAQGREIARAAWAEFTRRLEGGGATWTKTKLDGTLPATVS